MGGYDDLLDYEHQEAMDRFVEEELRRLAEEPVFYYLAHHGDAIEQRVKACLDEANELRRARFFGAALLRAVIGLEISIKFFVVRPLLQGAFLSDAWADILLEKVIPKRSRASDDRELLKKILRNWGVEIGALESSRGGNLWEAICRTWEVRDDYTHKGTSATEEQADIAIACLTDFLREVVDSMARRLGFTRERTGEWALVDRDNPPEFPDLNPPRRYDRKSPFD